MLEKIKNIEKEAKEGMEQRQEYEMLSRGETEKKLKIAIFDHKQNELVDTLTKTQEMMMKFKQEFFKVFYIKISKI